MACSNGNCGGFCYSILTVQQDINSVLIKTKRTTNQSANINRFICDQWRYILVVVRIISSIILIFKLFLIESLNC